MILEGDPSFIDNKEEYFMGLCKAISNGSTHPIAPGGCVIVRGREIIGDGRSLLASCKVEIDCIAYAIGAAAKNGTNTTGAIVYSTRYPFSASVFQMYLMGIQKVVVLSHDWEPYYKDEFRRAARLARELKISIEPIYDTEDQRFATNTEAPRFNEEREEYFSNKDLYTTNPIEDDDYEVTSEDDNII